MTISYPLSLPSSPAPSAVRLIEINIIGRPVSPFNLVSLSHQFDGEAWGLEFDFDPLSREEAQPWCAVLSALRGKKGTFLWGPTIGNLPLGAAGGSPKVNGGSQIGPALSTKGWPATTLVLKAGDFFQIDSRFYRNLTDATTDGSGNVTLDIFPALNALNRNHANNADIITTNPKGIFRLTNNANATYDVPRHGLFDLSFSADEAL